MLTSLLTIVNISFIQITKIPSTSYGIGDFAQSEIIMKKLHPKSQTTAILYDPPPSPSQPKGSGLVAVSVFIIVMALTFAMLKGCSDEVERQTITAQDHAVMLSVGGE